MAERKTDQGRGARRSILRRAVPCARWLGRVLASASLLTAALLSAPAAAQDDDPYAIWVYGDHFARWDGTRWLVKTELLLPDTLRFHLDEDTSFLTNSFQVRAVFGCEKVKANAKRGEAACVVEDIGIQAVSLGPIGDDVQPVLDALDSALTGSRLALRVTGDGRVLDFDVEEIERAYAETGEMVRTLQVVVQRLLIAWDMKLRKDIDLTDGSWQEYNPRLMAMPGVPEKRTSSLLVHVLGRIDGHVTVESRGKGDFRDEDGNIVHTTYSGVTVFDVSEGFLVERVWSLVGKPPITWRTPRATSGMDYFHVGRLRRLAPEEQVDVGPTRRTAPFQNSIPGLPDWVPIEADPS